jgi:hypothetical protein
LADIYAQHAKAMTASCGYGYEVPRWISRDLDRAQTRAAQAGYTIAELCDLFEPGFEV